MKIKITNVKIRLIKPKNGLIGFASLLINDELCLNSIGIHKKLGCEGYRLTYPNKSVLGKNIDSFYPITAAFGKSIEKEIFKKLEDAI